MKTSEVIRDDRIVYEGQSYLTSMRYNDDWTWGWAYQKGYRKPNYPVPAIPVNVTNVLHSPICITSRGRQTTVWLGATMIVAKWFNR